MTDAIIHNAIIVDGLGNPGFPGCLAIAEGRISQIWRGEAPDPLPPAAEVIDAGGRTVSPGFVDIHTHSDWGILDEPAAGSSLLMGVTTEIGGNCGNSLAPGSPALSDLLAGLGKGEGESIADIDEFVDQVRRAGPANNQGILLGQGSVRALVMGSDPRFPTDEELAQMVGLVRDSMEMGAFGMSTGRAYAPGCHAGFYEILELTRELGRHRGLYSCHLADQWANIHRSIAEVLELGIRCSTPVQIAHLKVVGKDNWGRMDEVLEAIEDGRSAGVDVAADAYPYTYSAIAQLRDRLPESMRQLPDGDLLDLLTSERGAEEMRRGWAENPDYSSVRLPGMGVVWCPGGEEIIGKDLGELATEHGTDVAGAVARLLVDNELHVKVAGILSEEDLRTALCHPLVAIGSDSTIRNPQSDASLDPTACSIHPREYGTFPRVLGRYVREEGLLTLEEAVLKMTSLPAERLELPDRGAIIRGHRADLVIFDPETVGDTATPENPASPPLGISHVIVNGRVAVRDNEMAAVRCGEVLRDLQGRVIYG